MRFWLRKLARKDNQSFEMTPVQNSKESKHIPELDGIRGVAIGLVLMFHYFHEPAVATPGGLTWHILAPLRIGWTGVDLFFVLSGFLIGGILLDARKSLNYFRTFYTRRFYRILPLYAVVVCVSYLTTVVLEHGYASHFIWMLQVQGRLPWFTYVFFVQNFWMAARNTFGTLLLGATWSLAVEEQFYITLPLLIWILEPRRLQKVLLAAIFAAPVIRTLFCIGWPGKWIMGFVLMPCRADALLLGVLAAIAMRTPTYRTWIENHRRVNLGAIFVLLVGCAVLIHVASSPGSWIMQTFGYTWMALLYALILVYALAQRSSLISRVLRVGLLRSLGKIAYGVYLLHGYVLTFLTTLISPSRRLHYGWPALDSWFQFGITIVALLLTFGLCQFSWQYFEKPLVLIGHRSKYRFDTASDVPDNSQLVSPR
jgi:peptidoglycan/LPS O-acetylase OafA/YrhL